MEHIEATSWWSCLLASPTLCPAFIALTLATASEGVRLLSWALGCHLPGIDAIDRFLGCIMRIEQEREWSALCSLALAGIGSVFCGNALTLVWSYHIMILALLAFRALRTSMVSLAFKKRARTPARGPLDRLAYRRVVGNTLASNLSIFLSVSLALMLCCVNTVAIIAWPLVVLGTSGLALHLSFNDLDEGSRLVALSVCWLVYDHLRRREPPHSFWRRQLRHCALVLTSAAASMVVAAGVPKLAALEINWELLVEQFHQCLRVLCLALPLLSPKTMSSLSTQARRAAGQGWRQLTRRPVAPRSPDENEVCAICHDDLCRDDMAALANCKWGCGRAVHRECMDSWRDHSPALAKCVFCGAAWS